MNNTSETLDDPLSEIEAFESRYGYDAIYMKDMLKAAPEAFRVFTQFVPMAQFRQHADPESYFTAKITAFRTVDCGPCLQLAIRMAREADVRPELIRRVLDPASELPEQMNTVRAFARAVLEGEPQCDALREKLRDTLGDAVIAELALAIAAAQVFPAVKRAMGHYRSCAVTPLEI